MNQLDSAVARLYLASPEDFVRNRDSLATELRAAGNPEAAREVKALRKPSRTAWALNVAASEGENMRRLDAAVGETLKVQGSGGDIRAAVTSMRAAVREFADQAAAAAKRAGNEIPAGILVNAVLALAGRSDSLDALRRGRLVEVPEGGGLDFLAALPDSLPVPKPPRTSADLEDARDRAERARETLRDAESRLRLAERQLRDAEAEAATARREYDRARLNAESATERISRLKGV